MRFLLYSLVAVVLIFAAVLMSNVTALTAKSPQGDAQSIGMTREPDKITSSWGKKLNPSGEMPVEGFRAFYFNRENPSNLIFAENVNAVSIKYSWSDFHNILSQSFAGYWVGKLKFDKATRKQVSISQSWTKSRVMIDGKVVFDSKNSGESFFVDFTPGEHVVEVEYINNWHTVEFKVTIDDEVLQASETDLAAYFKKSPIRDKNMYYVGLYESDAKDVSVTVSVPRAGKPVVLWLSSYEAIDWNISAADEISAVVISSYAPGSRVAGVGTAEVMHYRNWPMSYTEAKQCSCVAGIFHCEEDVGLDGMAKSIEDISGLKLSGYALQYSSKSLQIQPYNQMIFERMRKQKQLNKAAKKKCVRVADPDFDTMMR
jgi:hypothetical protein